MAVYSACPLLQSDSTRIVLLHPADRSQNDIHCDLLSVSLFSYPEVEPFNYTALSYAWGDPNSTKSIFIAGQEIAIGANLFSALQNLRRKDRSVRLWVDALSINQNDLDERSQQVQQMRDIYTSASETVIYLGPDDGSTACHSAWNFLELRSSWAMNEHRDPDKSLPRKREKDVNFKTGYNDVLEAVMSREWFNRIWVIQELVVSQQLSIQCGARRIPWDDFCRTLFLYFRPLHSTGGFIPETQTYSKALGSLRALTPDSNSRITDIRPGWEVVSRNNPGWKDLIQPVKEMCQTRLLYQRNLRDHDMHIPKWFLNDPLAHFVEDDTEFRQGSLRLGHLLAKSRKFHATDPRDKTFAVLGLADLFPEDVQSLIDYTKPDHQTYREMTRFILEHEEKFDILSQAGPTSEIEDLNFSSWAGRWSERDFPPTSALNRLGGETSELTRLRSLAVKEHHTWSDDGKILGCTGGIMGELVAMGPFGASSSDTELSVDDPTTWIHDKFLPSAISIVQQSKWAYPEKDPSLSITKIITEAPHTGHFHVDVSSNPGQGSTQKPVQDNIFIAGGGNFLNDAYALREGRMLGIVRCVPHSLDHPATTLDVVYSWGVVPKSAKVGDWVVNITGCRVLLLAYQQSESEARRDVEDGFRAKLPRAGDKDAEIIHCRLRGECRFSGFEDMWEPWDMDEEFKKRSWMTYGGYYPQQFRMAIFSFH